MDAPGVVRELFAAFASGDPAGAAPYVHPDCRFWPQGTAEAVGRTEPYVGRDGLAAFFADAARVWETLELRPTDVRSVGTGVVCFGWAIGRLRGQPEEQRVPVVWVFRLRDGMIVFGRAVASAAVAQAIVAPRPAAPSPDST
ncbi:MAG: nuclear transport factor 2 family protein [Actinomycetota bacterium]|nr:nuclear transport factor 2 family protein [Actinomycetota bacterium]